jgi:hypothetical protein
VNRWPALSGEANAPDRHLLLIGFAVLSFALAAPVGARAQLVGAVTLESEYRLRGLALTNGEPDVRFGLSYDQTSGAYAGATAIVGQTAGAGVRALGYVAYAGLAGGTSGGLNWDIGVTNSQIRIYLPARQDPRSTRDISYRRIAAHEYTSNYSEVYGGVSIRDISAHLYLSPDYLGQGGKTAYLDVTAAVRPVDGARLYAHAGALTPLSVPAGPNGGRERYDLGAGAVWEFRRGDAQLGWTTTTPPVEYPAGYRQGRSALVLSVTGFF